MKQRLVRRTAMVLVLVLLCLSLTGCVTIRVESNPPAKVPENSGGLEVHYLDVGQADCILLQCDGANMLIDGGNVEDSDLVVAYLLDQGVTTLDYVVNTHAHEDHVGGLPGVLAVYEAKNIWCPVEEYSSKCFEDFLRYADQQDQEPVCPDPGDVYMLGSTQITVLGPVKDDYDTNDTSIVLRADYGQISFLFSGDAEEKAEKDILEAGFDVSCTVMKAGHHGSETSTCYQWLRAADPAYAVISVGEGNTYGHPHDVVLSRLRDADAIVYRTDLQGHIVCTTDGTDVSFETGRYVAVTNPTELDGSGQNATADLFIGNKNSKKFHLPTCSSLPSEQNRIEFTSYDEAEDAGYTPCGNCIG